MGATRLAVETGAWRVAIHGGPETAGRRLVIRQSSFRIATRNTPVSKARRVAPDERRNQMKARKAPPGNEVLGYFDGVPSGRAVRN